MKLSPYALGLVLVSVSTVLLSTAGVMTRLVSMDSATMLFWRGLWGAAGIFLLLLAVSPRRLIRDLRTLGIPGWTVTMVNTAGMTFFIASLHRTSVAHVAIIFATAPFVSAGLGYLVLGERPGRSAILASGVALIGVMMMVGTGDSGGFFGDFLAFLMTLCVAVSTIIVRRYPERPVMTSAGLSGLLGAVLTLPFATPLAASVGDIAIVAGFGIFGLAIGLGLLLQGARLLPPVETSLIGALDAPIAPFWVWLFFNERLDPMTMVGGGVVMAAVCLHVFSDLRRRSAAAAVA